MLFLVTLGVRDGVPNTLQNSVHYGLNDRDVSLPELRVAKLSVSVLVAALQV